MIQAWQGHYTRRVVMGILQALKKHIRFSCLFLITVPLFTQAGGIVADGTRIVYPSGARQKNITVRNTDDKTTYLVQSWAEDAQGNKTKDFISTPPLFTSAPGNENILRLTRTGGNIPADRESLYYFTVKGIPSVDKNQLEGRNALVIAAATRMKMFVRPPGLMPAPDIAPDQLRFRRENRHLVVTNPTPYYLTLTTIRAGSQTLDGMMVPPKGTASVLLPTGASGDITFSTINDYGAITAPRQAVFH
ncbi:fimbria/pilus periplasmic chaperone [Klebsiella variicola]